MAFARGAGGARIHYDVIGDETLPAVVLVQGLGLSSRFWFDIPQQLATDPDGAYRVITLDNRGAGRSDKPHGRYRMGDMAEDLVAVMDAVGVERAVICGISMGGMIAQHVALAHPSRVRGLVLLATSAGLPHARLPHARTLMTLVGLGVGRGASRGLARLLLPPSAFHRARELFARWPDAMRADRMPPHAFVAQLAAAAAHSTGFSLGRLNVPAVIVAGQDDVLVPPVNSERIARRLRGSVLELLPDVAHGVPLTDERVVHRALRRLEQLEAAPAVAAATPRRTQRLLQGLSPPSSLMRDRCER